MRAIDEKQQFTITIYTENDTGLINRIALLFFKKRINITTICAGPVQVANIQQFRIVVTETEENIRKLTYLLEKQVEVLKVYYHTDNELIGKETGMYKILIKNITSNPKVERLLSSYNFSIVAKDDNAIVFEVIGKCEAINELKDSLKDIGLEAFSRNTSMAKSEDGLYWRKEE
ncbi:acetolactate synthase small subunit [Flavobacterium cerinum]|uniref:Acetolactate synthase small subunit n=1 Tax=Flavobacterium cerinum TaxID=2502784 RepID=A0ABY5IQ31_9FLAO|nr:acetolactate synthase small subunit [Flavobacterium cerinum]UUC44938.1 acetolactate synthase small subunit [Flavobacterium cerinum]